MGVVGPDEPRYAAIGLEMAESGDWVTPRLWGKPWFEKPALLYWMTAAGFRAGLGPEMAPRVPVALLSVWFLVFFFLRMRREFGERAAWFASLILATSGGWLAFSHVAVTEIPLATTFSASMLLAMPWIRSGGRRGLLVGGALLGLAVLAKGLVPLVLALPLFWVGRRRWRDLLAFCAMAVVVAAPWYVLCYQRNGWEFIEVFFLQHHFSRFVSTQLRHVQPFWFYVPVFAGLLFPWTPTLAALRGIDWREPRRMLLLGWLVFGFVFFSASTNKLPGYVLPLVPAAAALIGIQLATTEMKVVLPFSAFLAVLMPGLAGLLPEAISVGTGKALESFSWFGVVVWSVVAAGWAAVTAWWQDRGEYEEAFLSAGTCAAIWFLFVIATTFGEIDRVASARPLWESGARCHDAGHRGQRYGLNYYARQELPACEESGQ